MRRELEAWRKVHYKIWTERNPEGQFHQYITKFEVDHETEELLREWIQSGTSPLQTT